MVNYNSTLILAPHTDDGEVGCGGTISRFVEEGRSVYYAAFVTSAESTSPTFPPDILTHEVKAATKVLGIDQQNLLLFNYPVRKLEFHRQEILDDLLRMKKSG